MDVANLDDAIKNLKEREGTTEHRIGFVEVGTCRFRCNVIPEIKDEIKKWGKMKGADAVIWTDLPPNFEEKLVRSLMKKTL